MAYVGSSEGSSDSSTRDPRAAAALLVARPTPPDAAHQVRRCIRNVADERTEVYCSGQRKRNDVGLPSRIPELDFKPASIGHRSGSHDRIGVESRVSAAGHESFLVRAAAILEAPVAGGSAFLRVAGKSQELLQTPRPAFSSNSLQDLLRPGGMPRKASLRLRTWPLDHRPSHRFSTALSTKIANQSQAVPFWRYRARFREVPPLRLGPVRRPTFPCDGAYFFNSADRGVAA